MLQASDFVQYGLKKGPAFKLYSWLQKGKPKETLAATPAGSATAAARHIAKTDSKDFGKRLEQQSQTEFLSCAERSPQVGDKVRRHDELAFEQAGWQIKKGAVVTVEHVNTEGEFKLRNRDKLVSEWLPCSEFVHMHVMPCTNWLPRKYEKVRTRTNDAYENQGFNMKPGAAAVVRHVHDCGDFKLENEDGELSNWISRKDFVYTQEFVDGNVNLFEKGSLIRWLEWANVRLLAVNWLRRASVESIAHRRQDLPEEAFVPASRLADTHFVSLSYGWSNAADPDTDNQYAKALKRFCGPSWDNCGLFWDHKSLFQHKMHPNYNGDIDVWEDNLLEKRTDEQAWYFSRSLCGMQNMYFHQETQGLVLSEIAQGGLNQTGYDQRGWTLMESVGMSLRVLRGGAAMSVIDLAGNKCFSDTDLLEVPITEQYFEQRLARRNFTCSGDRDVVVDLYREGLKSYIESSQILSLTPALFLVPEAYQLSFLEVAARLSSVKEITLDFDDQKVPKEAIALISQVLDSCAHDVTISFRVTQPSPYFLPYMSLDLLDEAFGFHSKFLNSSTQYEEDTGKHLITFVRRTP